MTNARYLPDQCRLIQSVAKEWDGLRKEFDQKVYALAQKLDGLTPWSITESWNNNMSDFTSDTFGWMAREAETSRDELQTEAVLRKSA